MRPEQLAADAGTDSMPLRLVPRRGENIDREGVVSFTFNGRIYQAYVGDTVASALASAGVRRLRYSQSRGRPRGLRCGAGLCDSCLVQVDGRPNVRACCQAVTEGMQVSEQHLSGPSLPVLARRVITRLASLEALRRHPPSVMKSPASGLADAHAGVRYVVADVAVVGAGPAGISAALAAESSGARVVLLDENTAVGGHLRFSTLRQGKSRLRPLADLRGALALRARLEVFTDTCVIDWDQSGTLKALRGNGIIEVRARAVVVATGAYEATPLFENNDLPGIMSASAVQRLLHLYSVAPGQRVALATCNDEGWEVAAALEAAGVEIAAIIEERDSSTSPHVSHLVGRVPVHYWHRVLSGRGREELTGVEIACLDPQGAVVEATAQWVVCDTLVYSRGWRAADELLVLGHGREVFAVGRANGTASVDTQLIEGEFVGQAAAAAAGFGAGPDPGVGQVIEALKKSEPPSAGAESPPASSRTFVCLCADICSADLPRMQEVMGTGVCRGRMCGGNPVAADEAGPLRPVGLAALARPVHQDGARLPLGLRHVALRAQMEMRDGWMQPRHFGDAAAETHLIRNGVGLLDRSALVKIRLGGAAAQAALAEAEPHFGEGMSVGELRYGVIRQTSGEVVGEAVCARSGPDSWYLCVAPVLERLMAAFWQQRKVEVEDLSEARAAFALSGPRAFAVLKKMGVEVPRRSGIWQRDIARVDCEVLGLYHAGSPAVEVHCPAGYAEHVWDALVQAGRDEKLEPCGFEALDLLRLSCGSVCPEREIGRRAGAAVELDHEKGLRFLSRLTAEGLDLRLAAFVSAGPVPEMGELAVQVVGKSGDRAIGWVSAAQAGFSGGSVGLCWLPVTMATKDGSAFVLRVGGERVSAKVRHSAWNKVSVGC
jgi:sarcosine oxidase, subunit alpha